MKIKEFCEAYRNITTDSLKAKYVKENLEIKEYVPFIEKCTAVERLINATMYQHEDYIDTTDGSTKRRRTNNVKVNSLSQYLLFCRTVIEKYTNLEVETEGFYEEYDELKRCGLLDKLMVGTETTLPLIPTSEIAELRSMLDMYRNDVITNYANPQSYIANQVERVSTILSVTLKPVMDRIVTAIENMDEKDIEKLTNKVEKIMKRVK